MRMHELVPGLAGERPNTLLSCTCTGFCMNAALTITDAIGDAKFPNCRAGTITAAWYDDCCIARSPPDPYLQASQTLTVRDQHLK